MRKHPDDVATIKLADSKGKVRVDEPISKLVRFLDETHHHYGICQLETHDVFSLGMMPQMRKWLLSQAIPGISPKKLSTKILHACNRTPTPTQKD